MSEITIKACRVCSENEGTSFIFSDQHEPRICDKIKYCCANITINESDGLPTYICSECEQELEISYRFVHKCQVSYKKWQSYLNSLKCYSMSKLEVKSECDDSTHDFAQDWSQEGQESFNSTDNSAKQHLLDNQVFSVEKEQPYISLENSMPKFDTLNNSQSVSVENLQNVKIITENFSQAHETKSECENNQDFSDIFISQNKEQEMDIKSNIKTSKSIKLCKKIKNNISKYRENAKPMICSICSKSYASKQCLNQHIKSMHKTRNTRDIFICDYCGNKYRDKFALARHIQRKHKERERTFICETCGKGFFSQPTLNVHLRTHTGETPYSCDICLNKFTQRNSLIRHKRIHTSEKPYNCSTCSKKFKSKGELMMHQKSHNDVKAYQCTYCNLKLKYSNNLKKHLLHHTQSDKYVCNHCGKTFGYKNSLRIHIEGQHSDKSGYCNVCLKSFPNIDKHMWKHNGVRPYKCKLCPSAFFEKRGLGHHVNFCHKFPDKFKCEYKGCIKSFPSRPMLDVHIAKIHTKIKQHPCTKCSREFYRKNDLARHMLGTHKLLLQTMDDSH